MAFKRNSTSWIVSYYIDNNKLFFLIFYWRYFFIAICPLKLIFEHSRKVFMNWVHLSVWPFICALTCINIFSLSFNWYMLLMLTMACFPLWKIKCIPFIVQKCSITVWYMGKNHFQQILIFLQHFKYNKIYMHFCSALRRWTIRIIIKCIT